MMRPSILSAEVDLHHVAVLQDRAVAAVRRVVRRDVIDGAAGGEPYAPREARLLHQLAVLVLYQVAHVDELDAVPGLMMDCAYARTWRWHSAAVRYMS